MHKRVYPIKGSLERWGERYVVLREVGTDWPQVSLTIRVKLGLFVPSMPNRTRESKTCVHESLCSFFRCIEIRPTVVQSLLSFGGDHSRRKRMLIAEDSRCYLVLGQRCHPFWLYARNVAEMVVVWAAYSLFFKPDGSNFEQVTDACSCSHHLHNSLHSLGFLSF